MTDPIVESVREKLLERSKKGIEKYSNTMERSDLSDLQWMVHAQEELMDAAVYLERIIRNANG